MIASIIISLFLGLLLGMAVDYIINNMDSQVVQDFLTFISLLGVCILLGCSPFPAIAGTISMGIIRRKELA